MVENQLMGRDIKDRKVLEVFARVPRELFTPKEVVHLSYGDYPLPIGCGQTISQPYIVAYMTEQLEISSQDRVLEIGTGSGYQTAILAELAKEVYTIEYVPELSKQAQKTLTDLGYQNIYFRIGDGYWGWEEMAPFSKIIVTAAPPAIPPPLLQQLSTPGILIAPVGELIQYLILIEKRQEGIYKKKLIPVRFVEMQGKAENF